MDELGKVDGALLELTHEHQLRVKVSYGTIDINAIVTYLIYQLQIE